MADISDPSAEHVKCANWKEIRDRLETFPRPETTVDDFGEVASSAWVFRGLADSRYELTPRIERTADRVPSEWSSLELFISAEFKARAHMHVGPQSIPRDELTWLALMQHWGVPTRLVDFSYSPFVALYFAVRGGDRAKDSIRLWALDAPAIVRNFEAVAWKAKRKGEERERSNEGLAPTEPMAVALDPDSFMTARDSVKLRTERLPQLIAEAVEATGRRRGEQQRSGCVCVTSPPSFNPRLASQQGVFLVNCAETLTFRQSLNQMMKSETDWCKSFDIAAGALGEIEERLFAMNIHEQSLFPDMEGLAGLIGQRTRLHWK